MTNAVVDYVIYSDLRFTKCSSSFQNASDDDLYIYLYDVPGAAKTILGESCSIEYGVAEYTGSSMACNEAAKMMSFEFGTYAPICNENTPEQWEQCQCGYGDYRTEATCASQMDGLPTKRREKSPTVIPLGRDRSAQGGYCKY